jgi:hypothetical protein
VENRRENEEKIKNLRLHVEQSVTLSGKQTETETDWNHEEQG